MIELSAFVTGLGAAAGSYALFVSLARARTARLMRQAFLDVAAGFWAEAVEANQFNVPVIVRIHNSFIEAAALAPAIAAGVVAPAKSPGLSQPERNEIIEVLSRNAWALRYIFTAAWALCRLEFHARPWSPRLTAMAASGWLLMRFLRDADGIVRGSFSLERTRPQVEEFARLDTRRACEDLALA